MPERSSYRVVIIGAGFGGIGMALALQRAGIDDFLIVDSGEGLGGTWRDNTYPGAACDVPSSLYSYSFRPERWTRRFPTQPETLGYLRTVATEHDLDRKLRLRARVEAASFDESSAQWTITLAGGEQLVARAVVSAVGQLNRPRIPELAGQADFTGPSWHSARWNHDVDLTGKRVAVIGTGASAIQFVPEVAKVAAHVDVYQRSAPYVLPKPDRPYRAAEHTVYERLPLVRKADRLRTFLTGEVLTSGFVLSPKMLAIPMRLWHRQLNEQVADPDLRGKCVPNYLMGCKRVLFSNDWYPTLARSNVELVTDPIGRLAAGGVIGADETFRPADVVVYGTGFHTLDFLAPMRIIGLNGRELNDAWRDGVQAYLGISVAGFPNFFMLYGPHTNLGGNSIIYMLESQIRYTASAISALHRERLDWLDVRPEVQRAFNAWVARASSKSVWESGCTNWYTTAAGRNINNWPDYTFSYRHRVRHFELAKYRLMPRRAA